MPLFRSYLVNRTDGHRKHYYIGVISLQTNSTTHYQVRVAWGKIGQIQAEKLYPTKYSFASSAENAALRLKREKESKGYRDSFTDPTTKPYWWHAVDDPQAVAQPAQQGQSRQQPVSIYDNIDRTTASPSPSITPTTTTAVSKVCGNCGKKTTDYVSSGKTQYCRLCYTKATGFFPKKTTGTEPEEEEEDAAVKRFKLLELD